MSKKLTATLSLGMLAFLAQEMPAWAAPPTKDECIDAHGRGQDLRAQGELARARTMLMVCASQSCPSLIQADCAHFAEELDRIVPSLTFAARDGAGADVPDTQVFVDDVLVASRLDQGKPFEVNPGKHTVRFIHGGKTVSLDVVVNQGEKARSVVASFEPPPAVGGAGLVANGGGNEAAAKVDTGPRRPTLPLYVVGGGVLVAGAGVFFTVYGQSKFPSTCDTSTSQCAAAPGSSVFGDAKGALNTRNAGIGLMVGGVAAAVTGLIWYFVQPKTTVVGSLRMAPYMTAVDGKNGGLLVSGAF